MASRSRKSHQLKAITQARVKLCRVALLRDADASCIFAGRVDMGQKGNEIAVALGHNGYVVTCQIFTNHELCIGPVQRHTTLLHLLCQFRLQLLLFLFEKLHKKSGNFSNIPRLISQEHFGEVLKVLLAKFQGLYRIVDHADMTPVSRLIQSMPTRNCLLNWLPLFERLVKVRLEKEPSQGDQFIRSVIDKLCLADYPIRSCCSECTCEQEIFTTLLRLNRDIKTFAFRSAAKHGNFHLMDMFLKLHYSNFTPSFITPHVVSDRGEPNSSEPIIVYILKSEFCRRLSENQLVYLLDMLTNVSRIDINEPDADGLNALYYAANFKLRRPFYLLLNHNKFNGDLRNPDGESLEELFCWSGLELNNPAAMIALRRKTGSRIGSTNAYPQRLISCTAESCCVEDLSPTLHRAQSTSTLDSQIEMETFEKTIQLNFGRLCRDMEPDGQLLDVLVEHDVLPLSKLDSIASQKTRHDKVRKVLTLVIRSGKKGRLAFLEGLRYSHQQHLLDALKSTSPQTLSGSAMDISRQQNSSVEDGTLEMATNPNLPRAEEMSLEFNFIQANQSSSLENAGAICDSSDSFEDYDQEVIVKV